MTQGGLQLADIFSQVAQTMVQNQQVLNQADSVNQDHGDNMVQTFQTIASALQQKKGSSSSAALAYAAQQLAQTTTSNSGQLYAQGLNQAATQFKGQELNPQTAMQLLQTLIGGGQAAQPAGGGQVVSQGGAQQADGDLLGALLGGMTGGQSMAQPAQAQPGTGGDLLGSLIGDLMGGAGQAQTQPGQQAGGDMLGALLGGLAGGNTAGASVGNVANTGGLDMGDLLNAGMAFMQAKQGGGSNVQALMSAFMAGSGMGGSAHRNQSTQLVVSSFLNALGAGRQ